MFYDKRWLPPLFFGFIFMSYLLSSVKCSLAILGLALLIFKSYQGSITSLLRQYYKFLIVIIVYQMVGYIGREMSLSLFLGHASIAIITLIIALIFNLLLDDSDMIASISLYLRPMKRVVNISNIMLSILLFRCYIRLLQQNWIDRKHAIRLRLATRTRLHQYITTLHWFLLDILEYPKAMTRLLYLRGYRTEIIPKSYPQHKSDILYFLMFCGILGLVYLW
ncbi:hypothetical protein PVA44_03335 [Entomospira nematocerorum]|uniref:Uncharacterized protein n=1 Tax=Entomospira nematocerorum TaxID=2719987 RepID=A0A968GBW0_9SPIO|nr:hypothetical protein [Entomospira nematocera]NIZ46934.1 hypothetical protein [Entomospira nematocera]WDI33269.1 hypothetical protein PVA44_03335 [Entomospira nematocera]